MSILDTRIVNVALEALSRELDAPLDTIQWVSTGYLLALATVIPLAGWMSERFGSKPVDMTSVVLFGAGSALCGLAWSAESLIAFRVLQALGGGDHAGRDEPDGPGRRAAAGRAGHVTTIALIPAAILAVVGRRATRRASDTAPARTAA